MSVVIQEHPGVWLTVRERDLLVEDKLIGRHGPWREEVMDDGELFVILSEADGWKVVSNLVCALVEDYVESEPTCTIAQFLDPDAECEEGSQHHKLLALWELLNLQLEGCHRGGDESYIAGALSDEDDAKGSLYF